MKLLICTQILDQHDSNLGFFHGWVEEFAKQCELITVICLKEGEHTLPKNVRVLSLGKEYGASRLTRAWRFLRYITVYKADYDSVLVHMNAEYVVLGGLLWRRWGKKVSLWYAHKSVTMKLQLAVRWLDYVFTVADDSFKIKTPKIRAVGHGIDTEAFKPDMREGSIETRLVTSGRIAQSKHIVEMLRVLDILHERGEKFIFTIVGAPTTAVEESYKHLLQKEIDQRPYKAKIHMTGAVSHIALPKLLNNQDLFLNFSTTGNMDKAALEALAVGVPVLTTNGAFKELLSPFGLYVREKDYTVLADAVDTIMNRPDRAAVVATLRNKVVEQHSLTKLIPKIVGFLNT